MLYTISNLRKSRIQCFKRYAIRSCNEGVTAIASRSLQAEGRILQSVAKSAFCCAISLLLREFRSLFAQCCGFPPEVTPYMRCAGSREPQGGSQLRSPAKIACCCEMISQPFLDVCEISQSSFSPAKWSLVLPDICDRHFEIFFFRFLCLNFHFLLVFSHSCNFLARKYPRKGKLPSYINSLVNTKKGL